ncbi:MAG: putative ABC transporter permease [Lachnospiraceae bacterium]|nr:putative ABC transporter permease [Lachnospiraceae bacterium]
MKNTRSADFYILLFFILSFAGWLWEISAYLVIDHVLVNAGVNRGPYVPIYGIGGVLLWLLLQKFYRRPVVTFFLSMGICTVVEYIGSLLLDWIFGMRWWDYSDRFLNLDGRVCLLAAVCFGLFGMLQNCFLLPFYMRLYHKLSVKMRTFLCIVFLLFLVADVTYSVEHPHVNPQVEQAEKHRE